MVICFFSKTGSEFVHVVPEKVSVDSEYFIKNVIKPLHRNFQKRYGRKYKSIIHFDNCSVHVSTDSEKALKKTNFKTLKHPPYSPDLAPSDFFLFGRVKSELGKYKIHSEEQLQKAVTNIMKKISKNEYEKVFTSWKTRLSTAISVRGRYFE
jgi:transposase